MERQSEQSSLRQWFTMNATSTSTDDTPAAAAAHEKPNTSSCDTDVGKKVELPDDAHKYYVSATRNHLHQNGCHCVRCNVCFKFPGIAKMHSKKSQVPPIAQKCGTIFRKKTFDKHQEQFYHNECMKA